MNTESLQALIERAFKKAPAPKPRPLPTKTCVPSLPPRCGVLKAKHTMPVKRNTSTDCLAELDRLMVALRECADHRQIAVSRKEIREFLTARHAVSVWREVDHGIRQLQDENFYRAVNAGEVRAHAIGGALDVLKEYRRELLARQTK
jgi:hypothetical protein